MFSGCRKKRSPEQQLAQTRQTLLQATETAMVPAAAAHNAADIYFDMIRTEEALRDLRSAMQAQAGKRADDKRLWAALGLNTPLAVGLLLVEPVTGTVVVLSTILSSYTPTLVFKRILDDCKLGEAAAARSIAMDVETVDIIIERLQKRRRDIEDKQAAALLAAPQHRLFTHYPELRQAFHNVVTGARPVAAPERAVDKPGQKPRRRFGF